MQAIVDFQGTELFPGDKVAFGTFSGMLELATVTGSSKAGKTTLVELVQTRADGEHVTLREHPSKICKLETK